MKYLFGLLMAVVTVCMTAAFAMAAENYVINIQDPLQELIGYIFAALSGLAGGLLFWLFDPNTGKLGKLKVDAQVRSYLETAINAGLQFAENKARAWGRDLKDPTTEREIVAIAANYILPRVPQALEHFGIDETDLKDMILARFKPKGDPNVASTS